MPKIYGGASAAAPASGTQYALTTGTSTAYVATPATAITLADGAEILCGIHATNGPTPTLNVSGTGAKAIYKESASGLVAIGTGELISGPNIYRFTYNAGFTAWVVSSNIPDSTKLALDGSNDMAANISFSGEVAATGGATREIGFNASGGFINAPTGDKVSFTINGTEHSYVSNSGLFATNLSITNVFPNSGSNVVFSGCGATLGAALGFTGTQTSLGASVANIFRNSAGALNYNVPTGQFHYFSVNGGSEVMMGASCINLTNNATPDTTGYQLCGHSGGVTVTAPAAKAAHLCSAGGGTTLPEVAVHGLSETDYAGAIEVKAGAVARTNNGTWTPIFSLAKGTHTGNFTLSAYRVTGDFHAVNVCWEIEGTTLNGPYSPNASSEWDWSFVAAGSAATNNISLRVNSGAIEINVGTAVESDVKFSIRFDGMVN